MTEETLFAAALGRSDPAERAAFLSANCPDPDARRRVDELLAAHAAAGSFLDHPAAGGDVTSVHPASDPGVTRTQAPTDPDATADPRTGAADPDEALAFLKPPTRPGSLGRLAHYEVLEVLGSGGFGTVLKAFDDRLHRAVAVKVLAPQLAASGAARSRFEREARSAAAVRDEHVVNVYAVSEPGDPLPYLVMELVAGQTLQAKLDKAGPLPPKEVLRIGSQIARGLAAAHKQGLIHRDIKPANILLENGVERVKVTDFGLARAAADASISQSGMVAGTPMYMSPEQARGDTLDTRSDLFSLGSVLYVLCTGRPPFRADSTLAVLKRVVEDEPRPVREVNPEMPRWLADVVAKLHAKNPADRFQTAAEVAELLSGYLAELQQQGTVVSRVAAPPRPAARTRWALWFAVPLVLCVLLSGMAVLPAPETDGITRREAHVSLGYGFGFLAAVGVVVAALLTVVGAQWATRAGESPAVGRFTAGVAVRVGRWGTRAKAVTAALAVAAAANGVYPLIVPPGPDEYGEVTVAPSVGLVSVLPHRDGKAVGDWLDVSNGQTLRLPPGHYTLEPRFAPGITTASWDVTTHREGGGVVARQTARTVEFDLAPSGRVTVRAETTKHLTPEPAADGFTPLFNGRDLTGWKTHPDQPGEWRVDAGHLVSTRAAGYLFSEKGDWQNFHFRTEVHVGPGGNSGVFFRTPFRLDRFTGPDAGLFAPAGWYEADLFWGPVARPGRIKDLGETAETLAEPNQWFTLELIARGNHFVTRVNGKDAVNVVDAKSTFARGHFALQAFTPGTAVRFRKIEVKELPTADSPAPPAVAPFSAAEAKAHQEAWANHLGVKVEFENRIGMKMRLIPPGKFLMGTTKEEVDALAAVPPVSTLPEVQKLLLSETPRREVTLDNPFYLGTYEVTVGQFRQFVKESGHKTVAELTGGGIGLDTAEKGGSRNPSNVWSNPAFAPTDEYPVLFIHSQDARAFCVWLGGKDGRRYDLPREDQWEFACRAGTTTPWWTGDATKTLFEAEWANLHRAGFKSVGSLKANPFGLFDMHGNAAEWCLDAEGREFNRGNRTHTALTRSAARQPQGHLRFNHSFRVALVGDLKAVGPRAAAPPGTIVLPTPAPPGSPFAAILQARRDLVAAKEKELAAVKARFDAGTVTRREVAEAEIGVYEAKLDGAPGAAAVRLIGQLVEKHGVRREVVAARVEAGVLTPDALNPIDADIALAKTRLALARRAEPPPAAAPFTAEQATAYQEMWARHLGVPPEVANDLGMRFRVVPAGSFQMGSTAEEVAAVLASADYQAAAPRVRERLRAEAPARKTTLAEPFLLGAHEVTVGQFRAFVKDTKYQTAAEKGGGGVVWDTAAKKWTPDPEAVWHNPKYAGGENHPAGFLAAADARAFCDWLGTRDGRTYALPTEEQWEFACRAGTVTRWNFGDDPDAMTDHGWTLEAAAGKLRPVGQKRANPFGLFDTHGSAAELATTTAGEAVERGGEADESAWRARAAWRKPAADDLPHARRGFRVAVVGDPTVRAKE